MKKIILYFPYSLSKETSGSMVRPSKMKKAFKQYANENQLEYILIEGEQKERNNQLQKIYREVDPKEIEFVYMENSTLPLLLTEKDHIPRFPFVDIHFFRFLKKHDIPLGVFYRDVLWKFNIYSLKGIKRKMAIFFYKLELSIYKKFVKVLYLPSFEMNKYVKFPSDKVFVLPPAAEQRNLIIKKSENDLKTFIYVGGLSEYYAIPLLIDTFMKYNKEQIKAKLIVVCRKDEYRQKEYLFTEIKNKSWFQMFHAFGEDLNEIYKLADVGVVATNKNNYTDFAVPVKLFEYISFQLPVLATNCLAQSQIIKEDKIGVICKGESLDMIDKIEEISKNEVYLKCKENVINVVKSKHQWIHRVNCIRESLTKN